MIRRFLPAPLVTLLQRIRHSVRRASFQRRQVRHRYGGQSLDIIIADEVGGSWYDVDWPEPPEFAVLRRGRLREGATVFDLGAHQGVVALMLSRIVGHGRVIAVEAGPVNAELAEKNRVLNQADNLTVLNALVSDGSAQVRFNQATGQVTKQTAFAESIPAVTIDELALRFGEPDVVYVDIEGFEVHALRGATRTLARGKTDFFVEVHSEHLPAYGASVAEVLASFPSPSWNVFVQKGETDTFRPLTPDGVPSHRFFLVALRAE